MELHIDEEFQSIWGALSDTEYKILEKQIKRDGVLSPIIVWNGLIVDGHNRYMICKMNGIMDFPVKEIHFDNRLDAIEWIMDHQNGRRNTTDFQRIEVALRYEPQIAQRAKEKQIACLKKGNESPFGSSDQNGNTYQTREEVARIAKTSPAQVGRAKRILTDGTEEQIERARRGGREADGRSNSPNAIVEEIKQGKEEKEDVKTIGTRGPKGSLSASIDVLDKNLHGIGKDMEYTGEDLMNDLETNGQILLDNLCTTLSLHRSLFEDLNVKKMVEEYFKKLANKISRIMEVKDAREN